MSSRSIISMRITMTYRVCVISMNQIIMIDVLMLLILMRLIEVTKDGRGLILMSHVLMSLILMWCILVEIRRVLVRCVTVRGIHMGCIIVRTGIPMSHVSVSLPLIQRLIQPVEERGLNPR